MQVEGFECGPQTSSISCAWEFVREAYCQTSPQPTESETLGMGGTPICDFGKDYNLSNTALGILISKRWSRSQKPVWKKILLFGKLHEVKDTVQFCSPLYLQGLSQCLTHNWNPRIFASKKNEMLFLKSTNLLMIV